jgi:thiol peroxidase
MVTFHGEGVRFDGVFPSIGDSIGNFTLAGTDLANHSLADFAGKTLVLNIFPSVDTGVCAASVREFNRRAASLGDDVRVLCISRDLPFAHSRFCSAEGIENVLSLSTFRDPDFGRRFGLEMANTKLAGLLGRAVIVVDGTGKVVYTELVPDIGQEPDYEKALASIS